MKKEYRGKVDTAMISETELEYFLKKKDGKLIGPEVIFYDFVGKNVKITIEEVEE